MSPKRKARGVWDPENKIAPKCEEAFCRGNLIELFPTHRYGSDNCDFVWSYSHGVKNRHQEEEEDT